MLFTHLEKLSAYNISFVMFTLVAKWRYAHPLLSDINSVGYYIDQGCHQVKFKILEEYLKYPEISLKIK
jgi:hypothetical protein